MAYYDAGNPSINSTGATFVSDPSTATLVAELDSTQLGTAFYQAGQSNNVRLTVVLGGNASTNVQWVVDLASSTGLAAASIVDQKGMFTPAGQSAQYVWQWKLEKDYRIRARVNSSVAGLVAANLQAEYLV